MLGDVGPVGHIDVEVLDALASVGDGCESPVDAGTARAELGAELEEGGRLTEGFGAQAGRLHHLVGDVPARPSLLPLHEDAESNRRCQEDSEADERVDEGHSIPG